MFRSAEGTIIAMINKTHVDYLIEQGHHGRIILVLSVIVFAGSLFCFAH
jgi:hypothetical protein